MEQLIRIGFALVLLAIALSIASSFLAGPLAVLKRFGVVALARWAVRSLWRAIKGLTRLLIRGQRRRIRRSPSRASTGSFR